MLIHYLQIKISIHIILNPLISSLHSYDSHIKFITLSVAMKLDLALSIWQLVEISLQLQAWCSEHVAGNTIYLINMVQLLVKYGSETPILFHCYVRLLPPKWEWNTWSILISLGMDLKMRSTHESGITYRCFHAKTEQTLGNLKLIPLLGNQGELMPECMMNVLGFFIPPFGILIL